MIFSVDIDSEFDYSEVLYDDIDLIMEREYLVFMIHLKYGMYNADA